MYPTCTCRCDFFYFSIHQLNRHCRYSLAGGPVILSNNMTGLQNFKINITIEELKFAYFYSEIYGFTESHTFNSENHMDSKTLIGKSLVN